ncbi:MAG TPA: molybdopterin-synthase adenylyltransferase MoeB [Pseudomonadales bacterium]|nr:molybdopterin-synthase adenylyltransferase MoeB [Pseudomonadales bacterium]
MDDAQLLRYSRQIMLPELDVGGQEALLQATVLIVGLGGLGSPAALYLAAAGVGRLLVSDDDRVDDSNLQRQILHGSADIGRRKTDSAIDRLRALAPDLACEAFPERLTGTALVEQVRRADVVVDAIDNLQGRYELNRACIAERTPLVSAAAIRFEAQWSTFDFRQADSPCYRCLWPEAEDEALNCAENGVIAPLVGIVGSLQALETIKLITGVGDPLVGRLQVLDALRGTFDSFRLTRRADCQDCRGR